MPGDPEAWPGAGRAPALHPLLAGLHEDTLRRLEIYARLIRKWNRTVNLIGDSTKDNLWVRHFADSLQVAEAAPAARRWLDLGSGAGFPGLVIAINSAGEADALVHLIESNRRKCAFLREAARETGAPAVIHCGRIEDVLPDFEEPIEAVSSRALAPLEKLIDYAGKFLARGAIGVFPRGKHSAGELAQALTEGKYLIATIDSKTERAARVIIVRRGPR